MRELTELEEVQVWVEETRWSTTNKDWGLLWSAAALGSEAGEILQIVEKIYRKGTGKPTEEDIIKLRSELGDVFWNVANMANELGLSLDDIIDENICKINERRYQQDVG